MYKFSWIEKVVGITSVIVAVLFFILILFIGRANEWFRPSVRYYTILNSASDVTPGKKILYKGTVVGKISDISIQSDDTFKVSFYIYSEYTNKMRQDSLFIVTSELLGGRKFEILPGSEQSTILKEGDLVYSTDTYEGKILSKLKGYYSPQEDINRIINNVSLITSFLLDYIGEGGDLEKILNNVNEILESVNTSITRLNKTTLPSVDAMVSKDLPVMIKELNDVLNELEVVLKNEDIKDILKNVDKITYDVSQITGDINNNRKDINNLISNLEKLSRNLNDIAVALRDFVR
ncbi:MAG: MlaD family protein [Spirochaetia bacterium]|nr:MlaD family protein [Spirochaetota bacterium]MCX8096214.1 MlaD family protein [Spirochaetota bacterium]MDW8112930.1 MlaD family protein [Spirochaetia bacterium]